MPGSGAGDDCSVCCSSSHHDVGALIERFDDAPAADVRVRGHDSVGEVTQWLTSVEMGEVVSSADEFGQAAGQIVAADVSNGGVQAEPVGDLLNRVCTAFGVQAAGVRHDLDALVKTAAHHVFHLGYEGSGVARTGSFCLDSRQNQHGQLCKPVPGESVDGPTVDHLLRGREAVAEEAAAVGDADGC